MSLTVPPVSTEPPIFAVPAEPEMKSTLVPLPAIRADPACQADHAGRSRQRDRLDEAPGRIEDLQAVRGSRPDLAGVHCEVEVRGAKLAAVCVGVAALRKSRRDCQEEQEEDRRHTPAHGEIVRDSRFETVRPSTSRSRTRRSSPGSDRRYSPETCRARGLRNRQCGSRTSPWHESSRRGRAGIS